MENKTTPTTDKVTLSNYDLVIINSSGGKDSLCSVFEICRLAEKQNYPKSQIIVSHQDLGTMEWEGTKDLVLAQSKLFGLETFFSKRRDKDGNEGDLLEYVEKRGKWPSNKQRFCTSDFKRGPGARVVTARAKATGAKSVLYVFGFRSAESPSRKKKQVLARNNRLTTKSRLVDDFLPIHDWTTKKVWDTIKENALPYHKAYDLGMSRLSCCFCIFCPKEELVVAGKANRTLLDKYVEVEEKIGHSFRKDLSLKEIRETVLAS